MQAGDQFPGERWGSGLAAGSALLLGIVAFTVWLDQMSRVREEKITQPTAVSDPVTIAPDPRENPGKEVLRWKGQPYFLQTNEPAKIWDFDVLKAGKDDSGKVELYQVKNQNDARLALVKIGRNEFLALTPR